MRFVLAAFIARRGRRRYWLPIALYWRRRRALAQKARARSAGVPPAAPPPARRPAYRQASRRRSERAAAPVTWLSHVHLHFGTRAIERRFALRERILRTVWSAAAAPPLSKAAAALPHSKTTMHLHRAVSMTAISNVVRPAVIRHQRLLVMRSAGGPPAVPAPARRPAIRPAGGRRSSERFFRILSRVRSETVRVESSFTAPPPPARPPELVWRSVPSPSPQARIDGEAPSRRASGSVITTPAAAAAASQQQAPPRPGQPALRMKDFDPALLDRLTDDVIRRVERRARIERERHGR